MSNKVHYHNNLYPLNKLLTIVNPYDKNSPMTIPTSKAKKPNTLYENFAARYYTSLHTGEDVPFVPMSDVVYARAAIEAKTGKYLSLELVRTLMKEEL